MHNTVLLADDHVLVTQGLRSLIDTVYDVVGEVSNGEDLVDTASRLRPDIVILDISMPRINGLDAARRLRQMGVRSRFLFLTMHAAPHLAAEAIRAGGTGYVLKHSAGSEVLEAIDAVLKGELYITKLIKEDVTELLLEATCSHTRDHRGVTPRQREILKLIAEGYTMKEVGGRLGISIRTVESHKYAMIENLGLSTTADLIQYAVKIGLMPV